MEIKSFDNINKMPKLSKNDKIRKDTLNLLESSKDKLNRTFNILSDKNYK
jgi:hypothetical protein